jgi:hypothetical protein
MDGVVWHDMDIYMFESMMMTTIIYTCKTVGKSDGNAQWFNHLSILLPSQTMPLVHRVTPQQYLVLVDLLRVPVSFLYFH